MCFLERKKNVRCLWEHVKGKLIITGEKTTQLGDAGPSESLIRAASIATVSANEGEKDVKIFYFLFTFSK